MKLNSTRTRVALAAVLSSVLLAPAGAQNGPAGFCEFSEDPNFGAGGLYIAGGSVVLFYNPGAGPDSLSGFENLSTSHDPSVQDRLSSVRVGPGCTAGWALGHGADWGFSETTTDVAHFSPNTDNQADAAYCLCP